MDLVLCTVPWLTIALCATRSMAYGEKERPWYVLSLSGVLYLCSGIEMSFTDRPCHIPSVMTKPQ